LLFSFSFWLFLSDAKITPKIRRDFTHYKKVAVLANIYKTPENSSIIMLTEKQYSQIKEELDGCTNPLYFFHDDPDGLCSFLLLYRQIGEGHGIVVKTHPNIDSKFLKKLEEYGPDKIFVVDIAMIEQDFIDAANKANAPIVWIDHHGPYSRENVKYFNPRANEQGSAPPASYLCYKAVLEEKDLWIAMAGCIGDMYMPEFADEFRKQYPGLLPEGMADARQAQFNSELGKLSKILSFVLKGNSKDAMTYVKTLTRVKSPLEILYQETAQGKFIYKRYEEVNKEYEQLLQEALSKAGDENVLLFLYPPSSMSFTGDLANELVYRFPDKVIIIGREKSGDVKLSLRSDKYHLPELIEKSLIGLQGTGGGHEHAAGAVVKAEDFPKFMENLKNWLVQG
jgi:single-stranded DNA-specific DHH superfamily exonuclease